MGKKVIKDVSGASGENNIDWISNDTTEITSIFGGKLLHLVFTKENFAFLANVFKDRECRMLSVKWSTVLFSSFPRENFSSS